MYNFRKDGRELWHGLYEENKKNNNIIKVCDRINQSQGGPESILLVFNPAYKGCFIFLTQIFFGFHNKI